MPSNSSRAARSAAVGLAGLLSVAGALGATPAFAAAPAALPAVQLHNVLPQLATGVRQAATDPATTMQIGVSVAQDTARINAVYDAIMTPGSASYHQFMTPAQYAAAFSVPAAQEQAIVSAVTADGLSVLSTSADGSYITLSGTAAQVAKTFSVTFGDYLGTDGKTYRANEQGATVPAGVNAVLGLSTFATAHTHQDICVVGQCTGTMQPSDLWSIYDQPSGDRGRGQKIGIFGEGELDTVVSNLRVYETDHGLPTVPVRRIYVNDDKTDASGDGEWDLDSDASTGMAPDLAELSYYFGQDLSDAAIAGIYTAWTDDAAGPLTGNSSFGGCENLNVVLGGVTVDDALFKKSNMEGRTMFVSTGDVGGSCGVGPAGVNGVSNGGQPQVEYPSSSPYVVAVGGSVLYSQTTTATSSTQLVPAKRKLEYAWTYTGGGISNAEPRPADQSTISIITAPCVYTPSGGVPTPGTICRGVPDVASLSGDVATNGYAVYSGGSETLSGGTSLSSPLWAGMWARIQASHPTTCATTYAGGATTIGFAQPALYAIGLDATVQVSPTNSDSNGTVSKNAFFDIGNANGSSQPTGNGQQVALPRSAADPSGWDYVSGLGTPDITNIMKDLNCGSLTPTATSNPVLPADRVVAVPTGTCINGLATDSTGDEFNPFAGAGTALQDDQVDLTSSALSSDGTSLVWTITVANFATTTADQGQFFQQVFPFDGVTYEVDSSTSSPDSGSTYTIEKRTPTATGGYNTAAVAGVTVTGVIDRAHSTITTSFPFAAFNTGTAHTTANGLQPGVALSSLEVDSSNGTETAGDTLSHANCPFIVAAGNATTDPVLPDAPYAALLLLVGAGGAGTIATRRRRRVAA